MTDEAAPPTVTLYPGDCLAVLATLPDESISAVITDPPYGLSDLKPAAVVTAMTAWANGDRDHVPDARGFMGRDWDAFVPPPAVWDECLRVLKPGGHLAAFAGSRTQDLMGLSIRMAGFEIRDGLQWLYGSGFPKGLDVGKAIDKAAPRTGMFDDFARHFAERRAASGLTQKSIAQHFPSKTGGLTGCVWNWENGANVPTREQWSVLAPMLSLSEEWLPLIERVEAEREVIGEHKRTGKEAGTFGAYVGDSLITAPATDAARQWQGWNTALKPSVEPIILARRPLSGTVAATVLAHGTGAINVDACRTEAPDAPDQAAVSPNAGSRYVGVLNGGTTSDAEPRTYSASASAGRWPANVLLSHAPLLDEHGQPVGDACADGCVEGCAVAELDGQSGTLTSGANPKRRGSDKARDAYGEFSGQDECEAPRGVDSGGASRFFPTFRYQAKAPKAERPTIDGKGWPTVKPLGLMQWLARLLCPPGGTILDPFPGTGTTGQAAQREGFESILIERDEFARDLVAVRIPDVVLGAVPISEAACPIHGEHGGTVDCVDCLYPETPAEPEPVEDAGDLVAASLYEATDVAELHAIRDAVTAEAWHADFDEIVAARAVELDPVLSAIAAASSGAELRAVHIEHLAAWSDEYTAALVARVNELTAVQDTVA